MTPGFGENAGNRKWSEADKIAQTAPAARSNFLSETFKRRSRSRRNGGSGRRGLYRWKDGGFPSTERNWKFSILLRLRSGISRCSGPRRAVLKVKTY